MAAFSSSLRLALAALAALALARAAPASAAVYLSTAAFERPNCQGNATTVVTTPNPAASCADLPQASLDRCVPVNGTFGAVFCGTEFIAKPPPTSSGTYARGTLFTDATCTNASVQIAVQDLRCESLAPFGVAVYGRPECQPSGLAVLTVFSDVLCTQPFGLSVNLTESTCSPVLAFSLRGGCFTASPATTSSSITATATSTATTATPTSKPAGAGRRTAGWLAAVGAVAVAVAMP